MSQPLTEKETSSLWEEARSKGLAGEFESCLKTLAVLKRSLIEGAAPPTFLTDNSVIRDQDLLRLIAIKSCDDNIEALKKRLGQEA